MPSKPDSKLSRGRIDGVWSACSVLEMLPPPSVNMGVCLLGHLHTKGKDGAYFDGSQHELVSRLKSRRKGEIIAYSGFSGGVKV